MAPNSPMVHPFTFFLVNCIQLVYTDVSQGLSTKIREATRDLYWLCCCLDKKGQEALGNDMTTMEDVLDNVTDITLPEFRRLFQKIMKELHTEGYFIAAKMRPPTREKSMQDLELTVAEAKYRSG